MRTDPRTRARRLLGAETRTVGDDSILSRAIAERARSHIVIEEIFAENAP
jgi:hypothetical protein